jgi:hypothetical protein
MLPWVMIVMGRVRGIGETKGVSSTRKPETQCPRCWWSVVNVGHIPLKLVIHLNGMKHLIIIS